MKSPAFRTFIIRVTDEDNIGKNELERYEVRANITTHSDSTKCYGTFKGNRVPRVIYNSTITKQLPATPKRPPTSTTQSSETENSQSKEEETFSEFLHGKIVTIETDTGNVRVWESNLGERVAALEKALNHFVGETNRTTQKNDAENSQSAGGERMEWNRKVDILRGYNKKVGAKFYGTNDLVPVSNDCGSLSMANAFLEKITNLENRIKSVENTTLNKLHTNVTKESDMFKNIFARLVNLERGYDYLNKTVDTKTEQLSDEHRELNDAFEAECDHYDSDIKYLRQQLSELQQAFVIKGLSKPAIEAGQFVVRTPSGSISQCAPTDVPSGIKVITDNDNTIRITSHYTLNGMNSEIKELDPPAEPDMVEQIKAGENRLLELKHVDRTCDDEFYSLKEHVMKLVSIHTGLKITGIGFGNGYVKYSAYEKGIRIEFT